MTFQADECRRGRRSFVSVICKSEPCLSLPEPCCVHAWHSLDLDLSKVRLVGWGGAVFQDFYPW